jgi:hypothetical protein
VEAEKKASLVGTIMNKPRWAKKQALRGNHTVNSPKEYYRVLFIEHLDALLVQLEER